MDQEATPAAEESTPAAEESTPAGDQALPKKRARIRGRGKDEESGDLAQKRKSASPVDRPLRERKSVERYSALSPRKASAKKVLNIQQGRGEKLKDIPNVAFKLSKRKIDESLQVLHRILFGRQANVHFVKRNILQFSGFVWSPNEDKDRLRVREKLEKCNKDRLLEFCNLLDIYMPKVAIKKEEVSVKLLEFLESPHVTREVLLSENKKGKKRGKVAKGDRQGALTKTTSVKEKRLKKSVDSKAKKSSNKSSQAEKDEVEGITIDKKAKKSSNKSSQAEKDEVEGITIDKKEGSAEDKSDTAEKTSAHSNSEAADVGNEPQDAEQSKNLAGMETDEHKDTDPEMKSPTKVVSPTKTKKGVSASSTKEANTEGKTKSLTKGLKNKKGSSKTREETPSKKGSKNNSKRKVSQKKSDSGSGPGSSDISKIDEKKGKRKRNSETDPEDTKESKKRAAKGSKNVKKKLGKDKDGSDGPSTDQLRTVVNEILKEVDFNVATLADIIRQLGTHFNTDLMHRKAEIKNMLEEVINEMTDDEEEDGEDDEGDGGAGEVEKN